MTGLGVLHSKCIVEPRRQKWRCIGQKIYIRQSGMTAVRREGTVSVQSEGLEYKNAIDTDMFRMTLNRVDIMALTYNYSG